MTQLFTITPAIRKLSRDAIDTMITQLGKLCKLAIDKPMDLCPNCNFDPVARQSTGTYNGTGVRPFARPPCPVCRGLGQVGDGETFATALFLVDWQPKPWKDVDMTGVRVPQGLVQTKGYLTDMPLVIQAKYMIIDYAHASVQNNRFVLWGEPSPVGNIVPNRYFVALWNRLS